MINDYKEIKECVYKGERYSVRDNGAIMRHLREGKKPRVDDDVWTFGKKNEDGYLYLGSHRVHIIVATAFFGKRDSKVYVVDHIDTNRCNNRKENLHWFTRLENAINNPITRNKIIYLCGSIEAFIENPNILRERLRYAKETSLEWMRTVTKEEAKIAYENIKNFWEEMAKNPRPLAGGKMNDGVYRIQSNYKKDVQPQIKNDIPKEEINSQAQRVVTDEDWEQMTRSLWSPMSQYSEEFKKEVEERYVMSLTPNAAHTTVVDKPCYYPSTPQNKSDNPLQTYYDALESGNIFWENHDRKRRYIVENRDFSIDGNTLIVMTKADYQWVKDKNGDMVEMPVSLLSKADYDDEKLNRQLNEVEYKNGVYIHRRISIGFYDKEHLAKWYNDMVTRKKTNK